MNVSPRILGFPNARLDIADVVYRLTKCQNMSGVQFDNKNFDQMFDKERVEREWKPQRSD